MEIIFVLAACIAVSHSTDCFNNVCQNGIYKWHDSKMHNLYIGGIFPMVGGWPGGQSNLPSSIMALNEINLNTNILPNYKLNLTWYNSECNPGKGTSNLYELLYKRNDQNSDIIMILGPGCSDVSSSVAEAAKYWNLTVMSFGSSSPALSNRERFKTFYRTHPSAVLNNPARLALCKKYNWKKISTLQDTLEVFSSTVKNLEKEAKLTGIDIIARQTFNNDPTDAVRNLKKQDTRIIVGVFYEDKARKVFCRAYRENMLFPKYIWMIIGWYSENWYLEGDEKDIGCNKTEMKIAVYGHLTTEIQMLSDDFVKKMDSGYTVNDFNSNFNRFVNSELWKDYTKSLPKFDYNYKSEEKSYETLYDIYENINDEQSPHIEKLGGYLERALGYDAVWAMALALNKTQQKFQDLKNFKLNNYTINEYIKYSMDQTNFDGISGPVWFNRDGDRISKIIIEQLQPSNETNGGLQYKILGTYIMNNFDCCKNIIWGNSSKPPVDGMQYITRVKRISTKLLKLINSISLLSIIVIIGCFIFNFVFRLHSVIKFSMPKINNIMLVGCMLCFISVILFGLTAEIMSESTFNVICQVKIWTLSIGFSLAYGALFIKIWYVYNHSINSVRYNSKAKKTDSTQMIKLYSIINLFVSIDVLILLVWLIKDPLVKYQMKLSDEVSDTNPDVIFRYHLENCNCKKITTWIGILFVYKALLILLGVFLSYDTRNVVVKQINDKKFITLSIYNITILSVITTPIVLLIQYEQDAAYIFMTSTILFSCIISILLIFLPKVLCVIRTRGVEESHGEEATKLNEIAIQNDEKYSRLLNQYDTITKLISERENLLKEINAKISSNNNIDDIVAASSPGSSSASSSKSV